MKKLQKKELEFCEIKETIENVGLSDKFLIKKLKEIIKCKPKRVSGYDIIRAIELVAQLKGWIKSGDGSKSYITNFINMRFEDLKSFADNLVKEIDIEINDGQGECKSEVNSEDITT